jgi:tetratricopeptide (TPR) repeat protein
MTRARGLALAARRITGGGMNRPSRRVAIVLAIALGILLAAGVTVYFRIGFGRGPDYDAALLAIEKRDFRTAGQLLDKYLTAHPDDTEARLLAARTARRRGAFDDFQRHIAIHKDQKGPERERAIEYKLLRIQKGNLSDAERLLKEASIAPSDLESSLTLEALIETCLGALRLQSGQSSQRPAGAADPFVILARNAVEVWLGSHPSVPDQAQGLVWRGRVRAAAADFDGAVADFREAIKRDPEHFEARYHLAITVGSINHVEAATLLEQLRMLEPDNADVLAGLATTYRLLGRPMEARAIYRALVERGINDTRLLNELGLTEIEVGNPAAAEQCLRLVLEKNPDDLVANLAMSRCLMLAGKPDEAGRFRERYEAARAKTHSPTGVTIKP